MRRWWSVVLVAAVSIAVVAELKAQPVPADTALVLAADNKLGQALRTADKSAARRLLSLEFSFVDENGKLHNRKDFLANLKAAAAASQSDAKLSIYGRIAVVTGHRKTASNNEVFFLDIWALQKRSWRALVMQNVVLAAAGAPAATPAGGAAAEPHVCSNPCQTIPYRVRSSTEQDIINSFQALEKASVAHNAEEWSKHVADEFVLYRTGANPIPKSRRIAAIKRQKDSNAVVTVGEVQDMWLAAYNYGAAMTATHVMPDKSRPAYRAARVWVKRDGRWQMAISVQTDIQ